LLALLQPEPTELFEDSDIIKTDVLTFIVGALALYAPRTYTDIDGGKHRLAGDAKVKATVLFLVLAECPIARKYAPEVNRLTAAYSPKGVRFYLVHVDPTTTIALAKTNRQEFGYKMPVLLDRDKTLVRLAKVVAAPTAAVLSQAGTLLYSGRIDDRYPALGIQRAKPTRNDLRIALDQVLAGEKVEPSSTKVIGCLLPK